MSYVLTRFYAYTVIDGVGDLDVGGHFVLHSIVPDVRAMCQ